MAERREVALIVGGGTGIGYATAERLIQRGSAVALSGRRKSVLTDATDASPLGRSGRGSGDDQGRRRGTGRCGADG